MRKIWSRGIRLALAAALALGLGCGTAGAYGDMPGAAGEVSGSTVPEDASQGTVSEAGGQVTLALQNGVTITFTSAHLGDTARFRVTFDNREVTLRAILVEPGCIAYSTTPEGKVYTDIQQAEDANDYAGAGLIFCHYFGVDNSGDVVDAMGDNSLMGNAYARFGVEGQYMDKQVEVTSFYADDGAYGLATQEVWDRFVQLTGAQVQSVPTFTDVPPSAWYYSFVETVAEKGLFAGAGDGTFAPEASMTYAQFLTVLYQFSGDQLPVAEGPWYQSYVNWAQNAGFIPAGMASFNPEVPITRQDMAALFGNFLGRYDHPGEPVTDEVPAFADADKVADYAADGVTLVYQMGLMSGGDGNRFDPLATATRAQVAVTMVQMARVMGK